MDEKQVAELVAWIRDQMNGSHDYTSIPEYNVARYEALSDVIIRIQVITHNTKSTVDFVNDMIEKAK